MSLAQTYTGRTQYEPDYMETPHRLLVAVVCRVEELATPFHALLDTGSEWCVLPPRIAEDLELDTEHDGVTPPLHTRFGVCLGRLDRVSIRFPADEGDTIEVQATCFLSGDWNGPIVIGWKGGLERIRTGLDPADNSFYFGRL